MVPSVNGSWFARQVATMMSGMIVSQCLTILASPLITRLYEPAALGYFGTFSTITGFIVVAASLSYESTIVLEKNDDKAVDLLQLCLMLLATIIVVTAVAGAIAYRSGIGGSDTGRIMLFVPISVALLGFHQILERWAVRANAFRRVAISRVCRSGAIAMSQIAAGAAGLGWHGLIFAALLGQLAGVMAIGGQAVQVLRDLAWRRPPVPAIRRVAKEYRDFPVFAAPQALLNSAAQGFPVILLGLIYTPREAGLYYFVDRVLAVPLFVLGQSIRPVFFKTMVDGMAQGRDVGPIFLRLSALLVLAMTPVCLTLVLFGPTIFAYIFGMEWSEAGRYAQWLSVILFVQVVNVPSVALIPLLRLQGSFLALEAIHGVARFFALYAGSQAGTALSAVAAYSIVSGLFNLSLIGYVGHRILKHGTALQKRDAPAVSS